MPTAYEGTDIISCLRSKYIIRQRRISYRITDISLRNVFKYAIIQLDKLEFIDQLRTALKPPLCKGRWAKSLILLGGAVAKRSVTNTNDCRWQSYNN